MSRRNHASPYDEDETLTKLKSALKDADGVDMRSAIEGAIEDRKQEIRQDSLAEAGD